jgi:hypothetical protein
MTFGGLAQFWNRKCPRATSGTMLAFTGSRERTESEYSELLHRAGLNLVTVTPTAAGLSILEARLAQ